jgi:MFS family permease
MNNKNTGIVNTLILIRNFLGRDKQTGTVMPASTNTMESHYRVIARKTTWILFIAQCLGSVGFLAVATVSSIVGRKLTGSDALATVPEAIYQFGASVAALGWGHGMDRIGRRGGLTWGLVTGAFGALLVAVAVIRSSLGLLLLGLICMGIARSALQLARFAAAEVHPAHERARAISNVVIGGTVATFIWAGVSRNLGSWMQGFYIDELSWPYLISFAFFMIAGAIVFFFLRPDPRDVGRELAELEKNTSANLPAAGAARTLRQIFLQPAVLVATSAMVFGQVVMVMVMIITPLHMRGHEHELSDISLVLSSHVFGMYAFSILSGRLADRFGRAPVIITGAASLIAACLIAPLSPDVLPLSFSLLLLGLGWNFCFVGGSSLLADQLSPQERSRTQGFNDLLIGLVSTIGSLGSGIVYAAAGYGIMGIVGAIVAGIPLGLALWWHMAKVAGDRISPMISSDNR